jgi:hypothetical protein
MRARAPQINSVSSREAAPSFRTANTRAGISTENLKRLEIEHLSAGFLYVSQNQFV